MIIAKIKMLKGYKVVSNEGKLWGARYEGAILRWKRLKKKQRLKRQG